MRILLIFLFFTPFGLFAQTSIETLDVKDNDNLNKVVYAKKKVKLTKRLETIDGVTEISNLTKIDSNDSNDEKSLKIKEENITNKTEEYYED